MKMLFITVYLCIALIILSCDGGEIYFNEPTISYVVPSNLPIRIMSFKNGRIIDSFNLINLLKFNYFRGPNEFYSYYYFRRSNEFDGYYNFSTFKDTTFFFNQNDNYFNNYYRILDNYNIDRGCLISGTGYFSNYYDSTIIYFDSTKIKKYFHNPNNINNNYFYELDCLKGDRLRCVNDYFIDTIANNVRSSVIRYLYVFSEIDYQTADTIIR